MLLNQGEKIYLIARRRFPNDLRRHFVGEVMAINDVAVRVQGYAFVLDPIKNTFIKRPELRSRIISLTDSINLIHIIPEGADLKAVQIKRSKEQHIILTDGKTFSLDIDEFGSN